MAGSRPVAPEQAVGQAVSQPERSTEGGGKPLRQGGIPPKSDGHGPGVQARPVTAAQGRQ